VQILSMCTSMLRKAKGLEVAEHPHIPSSGTKHQ
jgi:hypothetical protein